MPGPEFFREAFRPRPVKVVQEVECPDCLEEVDFTLDDQRSTNGLGVTYVKECSKGHEVTWTDQGDG